MGSPAAPGAPRRRAPRARIAVVGVLAWLAFAYGWVRVYQLQVQVSATVLLALVAATVAVVALNQVWIAHNAAIYRRKGPRLAHPDQRGPYERDRVGRPLRIAPDALHASELVVRVAADRTKTYEARR